MRAAVLRFAFECLGAERAETNANHDNDASLGVTRKLGYRDNGDQVDIVDKQAIVARRFVMERRDFEISAAHQYEVSYEGVEPCLSELGAR